MKNNVKKAIKKGKSMKRPILIAIIGYIIGILWGLYLKINICLFYFLIIVSYLIYKKVIYQSHSKNKFKLFSVKRYFRYVKLIIKPKVITIFMIFSIISNLIINFQENKYKQIYEKESTVDFICIILSNKEEKEYYDRYKVKVIKVNEFKEFEGEYLYIQVKKEKTEELKYGDMIQISGEYSKPGEQRNYGGFNYQEFLKTKKICGIIKISKIKLVASQKSNIFMMISNNIYLQIKSNIDKVFEKEEAGMLKGLLLGDTSNIDEQVKENFRTANISHILAISGMHISYIIIGLTEILNKKIGKRGTKIIVIIILIIYMFITGASPSVLRATIMGIISISSNLVYRKNDIWTAISISLFIILIYNPYLIMNIGLQLSYLGTIGIILFNSLVLQILDNIKLKDKRCKKKKSKVTQKIKEILAVSISAQITILPLMLYHFNICGPYFILSNFFVSIIIGPIIILGFIFIIISFISSTFANILSIFLKIGIQMLIYISKVSSLPFSKIYVATPKIEMICIYLIFLVIIKYLYFIYHSKEISVTQRRIKNLIALVKYKIKENRKKIFIIIVCITSVVLIFNSSLISKKLRIYFVDVGQGDCTFIVTPKNKTILIDGGGSEFSEFDVGKSILVPYILDRGYTKIDYVITSHFDSDHVGGILSLMKELKVKNVIVSKQGEDSKNYQEFLKLVDKNNTNLVIVEKGDKIKIEDNIYFYILWPKKEQIQENILNNNSIVAKLVYNEFSVLFTGDIEELAEKEILEEYKMKNILNATILKVGHHGSKTSSIQGFIDAVKPNIALIGVGKDNNFGHPNNEVLKRLEKLGANSYRTDKNGEISISVNKKGKIVDINKYIEEI